MPCPTAPNGPVSTQHAPTCSPLCTYGADPAIVQDSLLPSFASGPALVEAVGSLPTCRAQNSRAVLPPCLLPAAHSDFVSKCALTQHAQPGIVDDHPPSGDVHDHAANLGLLVNVPPRGDVGVDMDENGLCTPSSHQHRCTHHMARVCSTQVSQVSPDSGTSGGLPKLPRNVPPPVGGLLYASRNLSENGENEDREKEELESNYCLGDICALGDDDAACALLPADKQNELSPWPDNLVNKQHRTARLTDMGFVLHKLPKSEFMWEAFTDEDLHCLDSDHSETNHNQSRRSVHNAIDLVPCMGWSELPARIKKAFVLQPLPGTDIRTDDGNHLAMHARLFRTKGRWGTGKFFPTYTLVTGFADQQQVLLAAQKATGRKAKTPYYILSTDPNCFDKDSESYVGKLRSNWSSTEYTCFGTGKNPKNETLRERHREELIAVKFTKLGKAPRRMEVVLPLVHSNGSREMCRPASPNDGLMAQTGHNDKPSFLRYVSKFPTWDETRKTFTMDFQERVRHSSLKNFQLVKANGPNDSQPIIQFGRWDSNTFNLDATYPFSIVQAFSAALTTFDLRTSETFRREY